MINLIKFGATICAVWIVINLHSKERVGPTVDPELLPYVEEWKSEMDRAGLDWRARYSRLDRIRLLDLDGVQVGSSNQRTLSIDVDPVQLEKGEWSTRATVFHELGHWTFGLEHGDCRIMMEHEMEERALKSEWSTLVKSYIITCKDK